MKREIRLLGIDDGPFEKFSADKKIAKKRRVLVIGTVYRGGYFMDGVLSTKVMLDGNDGTKKLIAMVNNCKFKPQLQAIFLDGIAVAGFNVIDVQKLSEETKLPVIVVIRKMPDIEKIKKTLMKLGKEKKITLIEKAGMIHKIELKSKAYQHGSIYCQLTNISLENAKEILKIACTHSLLPEPIRIAHIIAAGIVKGESRGRA